MSRGTNEVTGVLGGTNLTDPDGRAIVVGLNGESLGGASAGIGDGTKTVTTAGTAVALATTTACRKVLVTARDTNTDKVVVGASTVVAASGTRRGTPLAPGDSTDWIEIDDLSKVFVDSLTNGDKVTFTYLT